MSDETIEFCPWCGGDVSRSIERDGHKMFHANKCDDCDAVFLVKVPHTETTVEWTTAR